MTYGWPEWQQWVLSEEEGIKHIKAAYVFLPNMPDCSLIIFIRICSYDLGIQSFDTANIYSNGQSEVILGNAIKKYNLPREEIVVMTKVSRFRIFSNKISIYIVDNNGRFVEW